MNLLTNKPLLLGLCILAIVAGAAFAHWQQAPTYSVSNATVLDFPRDLPPLNLIDHNSESFTNERLESGWSIVFFGFTHCPDVCPTTMSMLANTVKKIEEVNPELGPKVVMISVDPERDNPELLQQYVPFFHPEFLGVTGTAAQIESLTRQMGVAYSRVPTGPGEYTIDHTSALFIVNPDGALQAISSSPHLPEVLANDVLALMTR